MVEIERKKQSERKKHRHAFIKQNQKNADKDGEKANLQIIFLMDTEDIQILRKADMYIFRERERENHKDLDNHRDICKDLEINRET